MWFPPPAWGSERVHSPEHSHMIFEDTDDSGQGGTASVQIGPLDEGVGFYVENGGWDAPADVREAVFDGDGDDSWDVAAGGLGIGMFDGAENDSWNADNPTSAVPTDVGFTVLRQVANTEGWDVTVTDGPTGDVRVEVRDVLPEPE